MTRKAILLSSVCLMLSGCITDKVSMSSEVGGASTQSTLTARRTSTLSSQPSDSSSGGLSSIGGAGTLTNILGGDFVGGLLDSPPDQNNALTDLAGIPSDDGLGVTGDGGVISDLIGTDPGGALLGSQGIISASLAGGNDGLLGALLANENTNPALVGLSQLLPVSSVMAGYSQLPTLGVTGVGGVSGALLGNNLVDNIVGGDGLLGGGSSGALAGIVAGASPSLSTPLNIPLGNSDSPLGAISGVVESGTTVLQSGVTQAVSALPGDTGTSLNNAIAPVLQDVGGNISPTPQSGSVLAPVSNVTGSLPIVGGLLSAP